MYVRPPLPELAFTDSDGKAIHYGSRWGDAGPPERTYSLTRHPERFAPLVDVANALIEHLASTYDVDVHTTEGLPDGAPDALRRYEHGQVRIARATTFVPRHEMSAPLVIAETTFPSVVVAMGAVGLESSPPCGCDACDEAIEFCAEELENLVFSVVEGRYQERYSWTEGIQVSLAGSWGARSNTTPRSAANKEDLEAVKQSQRERHGARWMPWPPKR
ncbi:DUF6226 family protein, partial [Demequina sp.]|uniref:DUF6226 family protein n=1 Tax=Demequina sp. TaxID=2050685 RepID=UPI0025E04C6F